MFARTIGLPNDPIEATSDLLDALAQGSIHRVGLGSVNGRYFLFHVGMGFDAAVVAQVERRVGPQAVRGPPAVRVRRLRHRGSATTTAAVPASRCGSRTAPSSTTATSRICLNTNPYTYLGNRPLDLAPEATLDRGLASVTLRTLAFGRTMRIIGSALTGGRHLRSSRWTEYRTDLTGLTVTGYGPFPYQVDGDHLGDTEHLEITHEPEVLDLVMPASSSA